MTRNRFSDISGVAVSFAHQKPSTDCSRQISIFCLPERWIATAIGMGNRFFILMEKEWARLT
jgi:hypothetical protein